MDFMFTFLGNARHKILRTQRREWARSAGHLMGWICEGDSLKDFLLFFSTFNFMFISLQKHKINVERKDRNPGIPDRRSLSHLGPKAGYPMEGR